MILDRLGELLSSVFHTRTKYITVTPVAALPAMTSLPRERMPAHVAIIMDGNGRWAAKRGLPRSAGHAAGTEALRDIIRASDDWGIKALSLYAFSTENWARSKDEVDALMDLLLKYFASEIDELDEKNVRIKILGDVDGLPEKQRKAVCDAMERTQYNTGLKLNIALNYGGRAELTRAARNLAQQVLDGELTPADIDEGTFAAQLYAADSPDVDVLIRTSGEMRTSNFLPWQLTYAEFVFDEILWPDFNRDEYMRCLRIYADRDRRFGGVDYSKAAPKAPSARPAAVTPSPSRPVVFASPPVDAEDDIEDAVDASVPTVEAADMPDTLDVRPVVFPSADPAEDIEDAPADVPEGATMADKPAEDADAPATLDVRPVVFPSAECAEGAEAAPSVESPAVSPDSAEIAPAEQEDDAPLADAVQGALDSPTGTPAPPEVKDPIPGDATKPAEAPGAEEPVDASKPEEEDVSVLNITPVLFPREPKDPGDA